LRNSVYLFILLSLLLLASACQSTPAPAETAGEQATAGPATATAPPPTATLLPPTATMEPTATAVPPTATPAFEGKLDYKAAYGGRPAWAWDQENVARYLEMHPDLEIDHAGVNLYGSPIPQAHYVFLDSNQNTDVFSSFIVGHLRDYVERGEIADISDLWQEMGWDDAFPEAVKERVTIDGKQYFVPLALQWNPIWYRTDIFAEVGVVPPESWEAFLQACDTLSEAGYVPVAVSASGWTPPVARWFSTLNLRLNGPDFHERLMAGEESFEDERVRRVFEALSEMHARNCFAEAITNYRVAAQSLFNGEAAMYNLGEWISESYPDGIPDTYDFFSFPILNEDLPRGEIVHLYGAYMMAGAAHPQEALRFLAYLGSVESQRSNVEALNRVASHLGVDQSLYSATYQKGIEFVQAADQITTLFEFNSAPELSGNGLQALVTFWQNPEDIDTVITALERARAQAYAE